MLDAFAAGRRVVAAILWVGLLTACTAGSPPATLTPAPTPDPRFARVSILATQTRLVGNEVSVTGTLQNGDTGAHDITLRAQFLDPQGQVLGTAQGVAEDVASGAKANFEIHGQVDAGRYGTTQVAVVSLGEQK